MIHWISEHDFSHILAVTFAGWPLALVPIRWEDGQAYFHFLHSNVFGRPATDGGFAYEESHSCHLDGWTDGVLCIHNERYVQSVEVTGERTVLHVEVHGEELRDSCAAEEITVSSACRRSH